MKYLAILHEYYECDNNTPSDKIWGKIFEVNDEKELDELEDKLLKESVEDEAYQADIKFVKIEDLSEWEKLEEIW